VRDGYVSNAAAARVYGVVIDQDGRVDPAATQKQRAEITRERASWHSALELGTANGQGAAKPSSGEPARQVHEYLVVRDQDDRRVIACVRCGTVICGYRDNYKEHLLAHSGPVTLIPRSTDPALFIDEPMVFRRYCCPGCQVLMTTEVVRASEPALQEMCLR
jgi:N-methylhydantoinase B